MHAKSILVSALLGAASMSAVSAVPFAKDGTVYRRCGIGSCSTTNNDSKTNTQNTSTSDSNTVKNSSNTQSSGNQVTTGNNGGGNSFGNIHYSACRRAYLESRQLQLEDHVNLVTRDASNMFSANWMQDKTTNIGSNNSNTKINKSTNQQNDFSGNMGQIVGSGNANKGGGGACRRELQMLEMERRELDTGASVLAALGARSVRPVGDAMSILATRDLGRLASTLNVRATGHDADSATHYKRDIGLECASSACDEVMKREAEEILTMHARGLGFVVMKA